MIIAVTLILLAAALATQQRTIWLLHLRVKRLESAGESAQNPDESLPSREQLDRIYAVVFSDIAAGLAEEDEDDEALSATKH